MKKFLFLTLLLMISLCVLVGCTSKRPPNEAEPSATEAYFDFDDSLGLACFVHYSLRRRYCGSFSAPNILLLMARLPLYA